MSRRAPIKAGNEILCTHFFPPLQPDKLCFKPSNVHGTNSTSNPPNPPQHNLRRRPHCIHLLLKGSHRSRTSQRLRTLDVSTEPILRNPSKESMRTRCLTTNMTSLLRPFIVMTATANRITQSFIRPTVSFSHY